MIFIVILALIVLASFIALLVMHTSRLQKERAVLFQQQERSLEALHREWKAIIDNPEISVFEQDRWIVDKFLPALRQIQESRSHLDGDQH